MLNSKLSQPTMQQLIVNQENESYAFIEQHQDGTALILACGALKNIIVNAITLTKLMTDPIAMTKLTHRLEGKPTFVNEPSDVVIDDYYLVPASEIEIKDAMQSPEGQHELFEHYADNANTIYLGGNKANKAI